MHASLLTVLAASAVYAQSVTPAPGATTEDVFTIQTSVPSMSSGSCYEVCIMEPCPPCGQPTTPPASSVRLTSQGGASSIVDGSMGIPPGETPIRTPIGPIIPSLPPPGATPIPSSRSINPSLTSQSILTNPIRTTQPIVTVPGNGTASATRSSGSAPAQQSTAAATPMTIEGSQFVVALAASGIAVFGAVFMLF